MNNSPFSMKTLSIIASICLLYGCLAIKPGSVKSGKNLFETFFVGDAGTQYYIKPIDFENTTGASRVAMDFTFRYKNEIKDSVIINFSILDAKLIKNLDQLTLKNATTTINCQQVELLFNEKNKNLFLSRFSTKASLADFAPLFSDNIWTLTTSNKNEKTSYKSTAKTSKTIQKLEEVVFVLLR